MKSAIFAAVVLAAGCGGGGQSGVEQKAPSGTSAGWEYVWEVEGSGFPYDFTVTILSDGPQGRVIDWSLKDSEGRITLTPEAISSARSFKLYFQDGTDETLSAQTTVWLPTETFRALKSGKRVSVEFEGSGPLTLGITGNGVHSLEDGTKLPVLHCELEGQRSVVVLDDPANPLVVALQMDFSLTLKSVRNSK